jgi:hypothetical protein
MIVEHSLQAIKENPTLIASPVEELFSACVDDQGIVLESQRKSTYINYATVVRLRSKRTPTAGTAPASMCNVDDEGGQE